MRVVHHVTLDSFRHAIHWLCSSLLSMSFRTTGKISFKTTIFFISIDSLLVIMVKCLQISEMGIPTFVLNTCRNGCGKTSMHRNENEKDGLSIVSSSATLHLISGYSPPSCSKHLRLYSSDSSGTPSKDLMGGPVRPQPICQHRLYISK